MKKSMSASVTGFGSRGTVTTRLRSPRASYMSSRNLSFTAKHRPSVSRIDHTGSGENTIRRGCPSSPNENERPRFGVNSVSATSPVYDALKIRSRVSRCSVLGRFRARS